MHFVQSMLLPARCMTAVLVVHSTFISIYCQRRCYSSLLKAAPHKNVCANGTPFVCADCTSSFYLAHLSWVVDKGNCRAPRVRMSIPQSKPMRHSSFVGGALKGFQATTKSSGSITLTGGAKKSASLARWLTLLFRADIYLSLL